MSVDVATHIDINAPRERVAAYAMDPDNATSWYVNIKSVAWETSRPLAIGSRFAFVATFLGRRLAYTYDGKDLVPGTRYVMATSQGPFPMETTYEWEDTPSGGTSHDAHQSRRAIRFHAGGRTSDGSSHAPRQHQRPHSPQGYPGVSVPTIRFDATLYTIDKWTLLRLPEKASGKLPSRGQVAVQGTINGHGFQTVLEPDGYLGHWMRIDGKLQQTAALSAGDTATLEIELTQRLAGAERATGS